MKTLESTSSRYTGKGWHVVYNAPVPLNAVRPTLVALHRAPAFAKRLP